MTWMGGGAGNICSTGRLPPEAKEIIFQGDPNWMRWAKNSISFNPVLLKKMSICPGFIYVHEIKCLLSAYQVPDTILGKKGDVSVQD